MSGPERDASLQYLWDMFGPFGLADGMTKNVPIKSDWEKAVVTGVEDPAVAPHLEH